MKGSNDFFAQPFWRALFLQLSYPGAQTRSFIITLSTCQKLQAHVRQINTCIWLGAWKAATIHRYKLLYKFQWTILHCLWNILPTLARFMATKIHIHEILAIQTKPGKTAWPLYSLNFMTSNLARGNNLDSKCSCWSFNFAYLSGHDFQAAWSLKTERSFKDNRFLGLRKVWNSSQMNIHKKPWQIVDCPLYQVGMDFPKTEKYLLNEFEQRSLEMSLKPIRL